MKYTSFWGGLLLLITLLPCSARAQLSDSPATVRLPSCLQYPKSKTYVPCTGVVPVDSVTGNPGSWDDVGKGTPTKPSYQVPMINNAPVNSSNPLPVTCTNCSGSSSGTSSSTPSDTTRRVFWSESRTPLSANMTYTGQTRDNGGLITGGPSRWNSFACFGYSDKPANVLMQASDDGNGWFPVQNKAIGEGGGSVYLSQPMFTKYWRCQIVNGGVSQNTLVLNSTFGM